MKTFYENVLPSQGVFCISGIDKNKKITNRFAESLDELLKTVEELNARRVNVFVAPNTFNNHSRRADNAAYAKSFFVDLDVGEDKPYQTKQEALAALDRFVQDAQVPPPVRVDSGNGIHAYWVFTEEVPVARWKPYAEKWKALCLQHMHIDPVVTADAARIMRAVGTQNWKGETPKPVFVMDDMEDWDFESFVEHLGPVELSAQDVLSSVKKGLDEDTREMLKYNNIETSFELIVERSLMDEGCNQIKNIIINERTLSEPLWHSGLSIARQCSDWETSIHLMSSEHPGYTPENTLKKANETHGKPHSCTVFEQRNPGGCKGCPYRGKVTNPLVLGRVVKEAAKVPPEDPVRANPDPKAVPDFPEFIRPYSRGERGGIYYTPPPTVKKDGKVEHHAPILILAHDLFPVKRMFSPIDGECLLMRILLPFDAPRDFLLPMSTVVSVDEFKKVISRNGVFFEPQLGQHLMVYVIKWGQYMQNVDSAEQMRMQMGWTEDRQAFVLGNMEITKSGEERHAPVSPFIRGIAKHVKRQGSFEEWKRAANALNEPGFEAHMLMCLCGFAAPLMSLTSTAGAAISFVGPTGSAKTGALYAGLSTYGDPKELSIFDATENAMQNRLLGLKNLLFGVDEVSNKPPLIMSQLTHRISHGKAKIRMQASVNAERELEMSAATIGAYTTNQSVNDKYGDLKSSPDGELARTIETLINKPRPLAIGGDRLGKQIFDTFRHHYGHALPEFIKAYYKYEEYEIKEKLAKWSDRFAADFSNDSAYRFYSNAMACIFTAGEIARDAGIIIVDIERVYRCTLADMISMRDNSVRLNEEDYSGTFGEFIDKNHMKMLVIDGGRVTSEPKLELAIRVEVEKRRCYVMKSAFKNYLNERQMSTRAFEFAVKESGILNGTVKIRMSTGWKSGMGAAPPVYAYEFIMEEADLRAMVGSVSGEA